MKIALSFICGMVVCGLIIFGVKPVLPVQAEAAETGAFTEEDSNILTDILPDIEKIYREALTEPFIQAESKIYDEDIAEYYHGLMAKTGLTDPNSD